MQNKSLKIQYEITPPDSAGWKWVRQYLIEPFDTSRCECLSLAPSKRLLGRVTYADKKNGLAGHTILAHYPGSAAQYPLDIDIMLPPIRKTGSEFPVLPENCTLQRSTRNPVTGKVWIRASRRITFASPDEAIVFIVAHTMFHFLRKTRQLSGPNTDTNADMFAWETLDRYRKENL